MQKVKYRDLFQFMNNSRFSLKKRSLHQAIPILILTFILLFGTGTSVPAGADTICMDFYKACHDVAIMSETKDMVRVKLRDGYVMDVPRERITLILKPGMKVYVYRNDWTDFTAWFRKSNESDYTFTKSADGTGEFKEKQGEIFFISTNFPGEVRQDSTAYISPWLKLDAWSLVFAAGFLQGILLAIMLFRRKAGNMRANRALALFIISGSLAILGGFTKPYLYKYPYLDQLELSTTCSADFLIGPLLYLYVVVLASPGFRLHLWHCLHLLPASFACIYFMWEAVMMNSEQLGILLSFSSCFMIPSITHKAISTLVGIHPVLYVVLSMRFLAGHRRRIQNVFSSTERFNLSWLTFILRFMLGASALWMAPWLASRILLFLNFDHHIVFFAELLDKTICPAGGLMVIMFFTIGYRGLVQPEIFAGMPDDVIPEPGNREQKLSLSAEKKSEIMDKVSMVMKDKKPHLDPGLTLPMLADMAGVSRNLLSQAINESAGQNFYDYVNGFRIERVMEHLKDPEKKNISILHIALDAGFNAKTTFNVVFKKYTGLTPSQFRKNFCEEGGLAENVYRCME